MEPRREEGYIFYFKEGNKILPRKFGHWIQYLSSTWRIFIFFFIWTRVLNHEFVEIKQFYKGDDIKQNNISTVILLIKFLVYQWDQRHLKGSRVVDIFVYIMKFVLHLISNHIFVFNNHKDTFESGYKWNSNWKYKLRTGLYISWINRWGRILIRYSIYR